MAWNRSPASGMNAKRKRAVSANSVDPDAGYIFKPARTEVRYTVRNWFLSRSRRAGNLDTGKPLALTQELVGDKDAHCNGDCGTKRRSP